MAPTAPGPAAPVLPSRQPSAPRPPHPRLSYPRLSHRGRHPRPSLLQPSHPRPSHPQPAHPRPAPAPVIPGRPAQACRPQPRRAARATSRPAAAAPPDTFPTANVSMRKDSRGAAAQPARPKITTVHEPAPPPGGATGGPQRADREPRRFPAREQAPAVPGCPAPWPACLVRRGAPAVGSSASPRASSAACRARHRRAGP
jgi:hypothetical protein